MLAGLSPARRRLVLVVVALLVAALAAVVTAVVLARSPSSAGGASAAPQNRPGPVLLVPGYGGATDALQTLADQLTASGRDATVVSLPGNGTGDLAAAADVLASAVTAALNRTGDPSVDLVGYSAGGVVVRLYVADGHADVVRRVLTLGSPHHGTTLADLAGDLAPGECPLACTQLASDSPLLARLNRGDETPAGPTWVSVWTTQDQTVTPPDSARLAGAVNLPIQSVCGRAQVSHGELPTSLLVQHIVLTELRRGRPAHLGAADCSRLSS